MEAYLCHLRDLFPVSVTNPQDQTWRDRVQELEDALREMKAVVESERIGKRCTSSNRGHVRQYWPCI